MIRRRRTGPPRAVVLKVLDRDDLTCICCGRWTGWEHNLQHRIARGMGGTRRTDVNSPANLLTMHPQCHQRVERRGAEDHAKGYWLRQDEDPALVPVRLFTGLAAWPTEDFQWVYEAPAGAA